MVVHGEIHGGFKRLYMTLVSIELEEVDADDLELCVLRR
jgi:hypothetical protein